MERKGLMKRVNEICIDFKRVFCLILVTVVLQFGIGCVGTQTQVQSDDPFESLNRSFHTFNNTLDRVVMKPIVDVYIGAITKNLRLSVSNFFDNLTYPNVVLNSFLQGRPCKACRIRVVFSSTRLLE